MKQPLISIIVPVYNVEKYLEKCINSILSQTYTNTQIIIINDGTKDNSGIIAESLAARDSRIEVHHKENGGLSSARNEGLKYAKGEFIMFIDSDDYIAPDMCEKLMDRAIHDNSELVECGFYRVFKDRVEDEFPCKEHTILTGRDATKAYLSREYNIQSAVWVTLYHSSLLKDVRFEVGRIHEDGWFKYLVLYAAKKVTLIPIPLYYYVQEREGSIMTATLKEKNVRDALEGMEVRWHFFKRKNDTELEDLSKAYYLNSILTYHYSIGVQMTDKVMVKKLRREFNDVLKKHMHFIFSSDIMKKNRIKYFIYFYARTISTFISDYRKL